MGVFEKFEQLTNRLNLAIKDFRGHPKERVKEVADRIIRPRSFEKWTNGKEPEDRAMQILSLFVLPMVIVVSFVIIVAVNEVMTEVFGLSTFEDATQQGIAGWFVTGITGALFLLAAWSWFQFVRTYGFGMFRW